MPQITAYTTVAVPLDGDEWVPIVDNPGTVPVTKKVSVANLWNQSGYYAHLVKGADTSRASTAVLAADPDLVTNLLANTKYIFEFGLYIETAAAPDWQHQLYGPAGMTVMQHLEKYSDSAVNDLAAAVQVQTNVINSAALYTDTGIVSAWMILKGSVITVGTAGNFGINWAQATSSATATALKQGSYLKLHRATA